MNKRIQALLLVLIFSFAASARLEILGWLMLFGFGSVVLFGLTQFIIHFYCMNNLAVKNSGNIVRIVVSHFLFASILVFQMDFDDSRSYSVLGNFFGFQSDFLERHGYSIVGIALLLYIIHSFFLIRSVKRNRLNGANHKLLIASILLALVVPNVFAFASLRIDELQETSELEETGEFSSIQRALKSPERVQTLTVNPYYATLNEFPSEIFALEGLKHVNLKGHEIKSIPNEISSLRNLETLNLLDNWLQAIPPSICNCQNLIELRIGGEIQSIPDCLKKMKTLKHLSFQSTHANELLDELREFDNLETAHFYLYRDWNAYNALTEEEKEEFSKNSIPFDREKWNRIKEETGIEHKY